MAMFPEELPRRVIRMVSFVGDRVLDPFLGSGTTMLAAVKLERNSVGYEINSDFLPVIRERFGSGQDARLRKATFEASTAETPPGDFEEEIAGLLYAFKDLVGLERQVDPGLGNFGSRTGGTRKPREVYHRVTEVVSPEIVVLDGDLTVRLRGVKAIPEVEEKAVEFLREKTRGARVYIRSDSTTHDPASLRSAYVYLSNRTFINAHLIKRGLADVDTSSDFKHKSRFLKLRKKHRSGPG